MKKIVPALGLVVVALAGCSWGDGVFHDSGASRDVTVREARTDDVPDIRGVDLAKAVKLLQDEGLKADLSGLNRVERGYGRQLINGYYQSHPRVVVVGYVLRGSTVVIEKVKCRSSKLRC